MKDLIILGNGMAGMTAALYAKRAGLDFSIIGKNEYDFGQIGNAVLVENYPCSMPKTGFDLAMSLYEQLAENDIKIIEDEVKTIHPNRGIFKIMSKNHIYYAKSVIILLTKLNNYYENEKNLTNTSLYDVTAIVYSHRNVGSDRHCECHSGRWPLG